MKHHLAFLHPINIPTTTSCSELTNWLSLDAAVKVIANVVARNVASRSKIAGEIVNEGKLVVTPARPLNFAR